MDNEGTRAGSSPIEKVSKVVNAIGMNMPKKRREELYTGKPPKNAYFGFNDKDLSHIHDLTMSEETKRKLYGLGRGREKTVGAVVESRLSTDSRSDLIRELCEQSAMTRTQAEQLVNLWMARNGLVEVNDPTLGKMIVPKE